MPAAPQPADQPKKEPVERVLTFGPPQIFKSVSNGNNIMPLTIGFERIEEKEEPRE